MGIRHGVLTFGTWVKYAIFFKIIFFYGFKHVIDMIGLKKKKTLVSSILPTVSWS